MSEENKAMVRRMVEAINAGEEDAAVEELFAPRAARRVKRLFAEFRRAFPDWQEQIVQLVSEGDAVAGRFRCSGTHLGEFLGEAPHAQAHGRGSGLLPAGQRREVRGLLGAGGQHGQDASAGAPPLARHPLG